MLEIARLLGRLLLVVLPAVPCVGSSHADAPIPVTIGASTYCHLPVACRIAADDPARVQTPHQDLSATLTWRDDSAAVCGRGESTADVTFYPPPCHFALHWCAGTLRS